MGRTLEQSLRNAERIREELPELVQPEAEAYDMVNLADEIYRLRKELEVAVQQEREACAEACEELDAFQYDDPGASYAEAVRARSST